MGGRRQVKQHDRVTQLGDAKRWLEGLIIGDCQSKRESQIATQTKEHRGQHCTSINPENIPIAGVHGLELITVVESSSTTSVGRLKSIASILLLGNASGLFGNGGTGLVGSAIE